jgi:hypothetical protein
MRWPALARNTHKWLGLVIGVQAVLWTVSGLYMTAVHLDIIHGDHLVRHAPPPPLDLARLVEPGAVMTAAPSQAVRLETQLGQPVYIVTGDSGRALFDARTGDRLSPLGQAAAEARAKALYAGAGPIRRAEKLSKAPPEIRGRPAPVWRVEFQGWWRPTLYISAQTGELVAKRHDLWRIFDFVWMFHIMDYQARENVNNTLLRIATWTAVAGCASGAWLLIFSFRRRRRARKAAA